MEKSFLFVALISVAFCFFVCRRSIFNFDLLPSKKEFRPFLAQAKTRVRKFFRKPTFSGKKERNCTVTVQGVVIQLTRW